MLLAGNNQARAVLRVLAVGADGQVHSRSSPGQSPRTATSSIAPSPERAPRRSRRRSGTVRDMPSALVLKTMNVVHRGVLKVSGGRVGWRVGAMPVLELTTTGRTSGRPRSVMLTSPVRDGDAIVVVASRGGDDRHPDWFVNLRADPDVQVALTGAPKRAMRARVATPDERAELWPRVVAAYRGYAGYQSKTERIIPLVLLEASDTVAG